MRLSFSFGAPPGETFAKDAFARQPDTIVFAGRQATVIAVTVTDDGSAALFDLEVPDDLTELFPGPLTAISYRHQEDQHGTAHD